MGLLVAVGILLAIVVFAAAFRPGRRRKVGIERLRRQYVRMLQMPPPAAQQTLRRVLAEMEKAYPDRSTRWHLKRMIADLQRDRR